MLGGWWIRRKPAQSVFICGCGHSGTSILAAVLAAHPGIYVPPRESDAFHGTDRQVSRKSAALYREHAASSRRVLVEKTPRHIHHLDRIRNLVPGALFILPVRDGRDVAASICKRTGSLAEGEKRWITENLMVAAQRGRADCLVYRYEDFIEDPPATVERVCEFIGVEFVPEMLEYHRTPRLWFGQSSVAESSPEGNGHRAHRNWQINQPVFDGRGRWPSAHSEADFPHLGTGKGLDLMRLFGYVASDHQPDVMIENIRSPHIANTLMEVWSRSVDV